MTKTMRLFMGSQLSLYIATLICILIRPRGLLANQGISYYGNYTTTIVPYVAGLLICAGLALATAEMMPRNRQTSPIRYSFYLFSLAIIGIVATPIQVSPWVRSAHDLIVITLFTLQIVLSAWLIERFKSDWQNLVLLIIQILSATAAAFYIHPPTGFLMESQLVFEITFGLIVLRSLNVVEVTAGNQNNHIKNNGRPSQAPKSPA